MSLQGRGNAIHVTAAALVVCVVVLLPCEVAQAATFTVGDATGWTFNVANWPNGKSFKTGDILVFNYNTGLHSVVIVNKADFDNCNFGNGRILSSGNDQVTLAKGLNYFICGTPGHCASGGMKIAVTAN